ncbi:MAG: phosphopantothenoylcysteine decarboxylase [Spirochaetota bacterium]
MTGGVAAVGDRRSVDRHEEKVPRAENARVHMELEPTARIVDGVRRQQPGVSVVAFRALSHASRDKLIADARLRLQRGQADLIPMSWVPPKGNCREQCIF